MTPHDPVDDLLIPLPDDTPTQLQDDGTLPHTYLLSYGNGAETPTRVRTVAGRATFVVGIIGIIVTGGLAGLIYLEASKFKSSALGGGPVRWLAFWEEEKYLLMIVAIFAATALIQLILAGAVRRGNMAAAIFLAFSLIPMALGALLVASATAIIGIIGVFQRPHELSLALIPSALSILFTLLLKDLSAYLLWIARNPIREKPPVPFLPVT